MQREKHRFVWGAAIAAVAVRGVFLVLQKIDSDEPQHLHIAWAWTKGLVQYRDVFDNHLPLLHLLFAPVMSVMPESSSAFLLMRLAILPFAVGCSVLLYLFAREHFGERVAIAAALLFSVMPPWLATSVEFRNDTLWIFFWLAGLVLLSRGQTQWVGVAFALSLLASIKAAPLLLAHGLALATQGQLDRTSIRNAMRMATAASIPLFLAVSWMWAAGALDEMIYSTLLFNASAPVNPARRISGAIGFAIVAAVISVKRRTEINVGAHIAYVSIWYVALLLGFWPILTPRDFLPLVPLAALLIAAKLPSSQRILAAALVACVVASFVDERLWRPREHVREDFVDAVARLTSENDTIFDLKGDAVFRQRAAEYVYEDVGRALTAKGAIPDSGPEEIVARECCVAMRDSSHIPPRTRAFLNQHFLGDGLVRVCGLDVRGSTFDIAVPQTYAVIARNPAAVTIDGTPYRAPRPLAAGPHRITTGNNERVRIIWWRAAKETM